MTRLHPLGLHSQCPVPAQEPFVQQVLFKAHTHTYTCTHTESLGLKAPGTHPVDVGSWY